MVWFMNLIFAMVIVAMSIVYCCAIMSGREGVPWFIAIMILGTMTYTISIL